MINHEDLDLFINQKPVQSISKKKSKSASVSVNRCSAFNTSCRKVSKFDVVDPLNCSLVTPGPGHYQELDRFEYRPSYTMANLEKLEEQLSTQRFFSDASDKIVFKRVKNAKAENLNLLHPAEPSISFPKVSADRRLWEPNNYYHPYKLPERQNPGPGNYEKHWGPVKAEKTNWVFKSSREKFEEILPRGIGPGSYSLDPPRKLPDWDQFGSRAERKTKIKLDDSVNLAPAPGIYTPYIPPNTHSSSYVFNSASKRGCQVFPKESAGPGSYNLDIPIRKSITFTQTERDKFEYFKGKPGLGPAHYVNNKKEPARACSFEYYGERFFPVDKTGVYIIPEEEDDKGNQEIREKVIIKKKNNLPFNCGEERFNKKRDVWVKKKVAPDPGTYDVKEKKNKGFSASKSPRFSEKKNKVPGPGEYEVHYSPLKTTNNKEFLNSI